MGTSLDNWARGVAVSSEKAARALMSAYSTVARTADRGLAGKKHGKKTA
jgi:hypothetical protein